MSSGHEALLVLLLRSPLMCFACIAETVTALERVEAPADAAAGDDLAYDIDVPLRLPKRPDAAARCLLVSAGGERVQLCTTARLDLLEVPRDAFWALPRILREAGCAAWLSGALDLRLEGATRPELALWIDLPMLAAELKRSRSTPKAFSQ